MAGELTLTLGVKYANGNLKDSVQTETLTVNCNTVVLGLDSKVQTATNVAANADLSQLTTLGYAYLKNVSVSDDFLQYGPISGANWNVVGRLYTNESALLRLEPGITLRWVCNSNTNTNTIKVLLRGYNN